MRLDRASERRDSAERPLGQALQGRDAFERALGQARTRFRILAVVAALAAPVAATAGETGRSVQVAFTRIVPASLMAKAQAHPNQVFNVIMQGSRGTKTPRSPVREQFAQRRGRPGEGHQAPVHERERRLREP